MSVALADNLVTGAHKFITPDTFIQVHTSITRIGRSFFHNCVTVKNVIVEK